MDWESLMDRQGARRQKEGQEDQGTSSQLGGLPPGSLPLPGPPGLPFASGLPVNPSSYPNPSSDPHVEA